MLYLQTILSLASLSSFLSAQSTTATSTYGSALTKADLSTPPPTEANLDWLVPGEHEQDCGDHTFCDLRYYYCVPKLELCDSCAAECGDADTLPPDQRDHCMLVCKVYYEYQAQQAATTQSTPPASSVTADSDLQGVHRELDQLRTYVIIGSVLGGLAIVVLATATVVFYRQMKEARRKRKTDSTHMENALLVDAEASFTEHSDRAAETDAEVHADVVVHRSG